MRTYLAGPMSGIKWFNFAAFDAAAADLRRQGIAVISPTDLDREAGFDPYKLPEDRDWTVYPGGLRKEAFIRDMLAISECDAIHLLPGWQNSKGAKAERAVAEWLGLAVFEYQPPSRQIVGLFGYYGSGKDESAKALTALGWQRVAFADPVREMALAIDPIVRSFDPVVTASVRLSEEVNIHGWTKAKRNPEVRRLLQRIGTEAVRTIVGPDTWTQIAERSIPRDKSVVFTDVRFANEAEFIRRMGGKLIQICRPGHKPVTDHASEQYPFEADEQIINDGTIEELHVKVLNSVCHSAVQSV